MLTLPEIGSDVRGRGHKARPETVAPITRLIEPGRLYAHPQNARDGIAGERDITHAFAAFPQQPEHRSGDDTGRGEPGAQMGQRGEGTALWGGDSPGSNGLISSGDLGTRTCFCFSRSLKSIRSPDASK